MAELTQKERLQPALLDRLTDDSPGELKESRDSRVMSLQQLRECVLRDLVWLLNAENLESVVDLENHPAAKASVINYGIPATAGSVASGIETTKLERRVKEALINFEPRLLKDTITVRAIQSYEEMSRKTVVFDIGGELWAQPVPIKMYIRTELDLETGKVNVSEPPK